MNAKQALAEARRRWGSGAAVKDQGKQSSPELREAACERWKAINADEPAKGSHEDARRTWRSLRSAAMWQSTLYRYSVGHLALDGMFFMVDGQGDSWEEAFAAHDAFVARYATPKKK